jgi:hypothetical protein
MALAQAIPAVLSGYVAVATVDSNMPVFIGSVTIAIAGILFWILFKPGRDDVYGAEIN